MWKHGGSFFKKGCKYATGGMMQLAALQTFFSIRHCLLKDNNLLLNVLLIGESEVGKTSIVQQFCDKVSNGLERTLGVDLYLKRLE